MIEQISNQRDKNDMNIVIVGHVDHGKSTIIGRMLVDTDSLPEGKLEQVRETCRRNSKPFEYAFLLDALKDEQSQGITIDNARCFFKTNKRRYIIIDSPGHIEFLKNMITGASRAEAALLVIDANEGIQENSLRHGYMLSMLGIKQVTVLINKMDLVNYDREVYKSIVNEYIKFLNKIDVMPKSFIPVSGMIGDNIASKSNKMEWYEGNTVLEELDDFKNEEMDDNKNFRMPVQGVYKFTRDGDKRRIVAGTVSTGNINVGDEVTFLPSGKKSRIKSIEGFNIAKKYNASAGQPVGFTLEEQIYIKRGEVMVSSKDDSSVVTSRFKANLFWLGNKPMNVGKKYLLKIGTTKVGVTLEKVVRVIDASSLKEQESNTIRKHMVAECIMRTDSAIAFDIATEILETGRFVIIDDYIISGGGLILEEIEDTQMWVRDKVLKRNSRWEKSMIGYEERIRQYNQVPTLIMISGNNSELRKSFAKELEKRLFMDEKIVYYIGISSVLYGIDADIKDISPSSDKEYMRRLAEVANILLDAGLILIVTAKDICNYDLNIIKTSINNHNLISVWIGDNICTDLNPTIKIDEKSIEDGLTDIVSMIYEDKL
ncbi:GTP-binding protein [Sporosalibacterium faouarense]|uniref:GTP-binding protein n=1 Tax=Sporosalibacterium faouarense TaxID=516123 RepID=UPI00141D584F|nr:GTP-binding protein [Sporosalibacterium faouarense]MTI48982.1 adenylyl-sulfate kinase [Bacillota bacterium]